MELEGFNRCLDNIEKNNRIKVSELITDRHSQVQKEVREKRSHITHYYDVWHVSKGILVNYFNA